MKRHLLLFLLFSFFIANSFGQQITFQESIAENPIGCDSNIYCGAGTYAGVNDMKETSDNGFIVTGSLSQLNSNTLLSNFLMKLDKNGDTAWVKYFVSTSFFQSYIAPFGGSVLQACDGGYITSGNGGISKTDSAGNLLWAKYYPSVQYASYLAKTNDCGFILACITDSFGTGGYDIYVIRTDAVGNPLWSKTYGGAGDDEPTAIQQTADGGYIIAGYTSSFDTSGYMACLIKTDANGDTLWTKTYGPPTPSYYGSSNYSVQQTYDHGYILLNDNMIKTDSNGNILWSNDLGGNSIQQTSDSGYIILGDGDYLIKTNNIGNVLWARNFPPWGERNYKWATLALQTHDGGYIAADQFQYADDPADPFWSADIIKTDAKGQSGCNETNATFTASPAAITASCIATVVTSLVTAEIDTTFNLINDTIMAIGENCYSDGIAEVHSENSIILYPNPATNQLTIHPVGWSSNGVNTSSFHNEAVTVSIMNVLGQETLSHSLSFGEGRGETLDVSGLAAGIYFVEVVGENGRWMGKFVKQ